jgi:DNA-binding MarR family transcriptional regulator
MSNARRSGRGFRVSDEFVANNPTADPTASELLINLLVTSTLFQARLDDLLREYRLTLGSFNVLNVVAGDPEPLTPSEIASRVVVPVTTATLTGILDTLQRHGYVERQPHPTDRRRLLIHLTANGRRVLAKVLPRIFEQEKQVTAELSDATRKRLTAGLAALQDGLRNSAEERP